MTQFLTAFTNTNFVIKTKINLLQLQHSMYAILST